MKKIFLVLFIALVGASCVKQDDIVLHSIEKITISSETNLSAELRMENKSATKVVIKDLNLDVKLGGKNFLKVVLRDDFVVARKSNDVVTLDLAYKLQNPLAMLSFLNKNFSPNKMLNQMSITGEAKIKAGMVTKRFELNHSSLGELLNNLGVDEKQLFKGLKL